MKAIQIKNAHTNNLKNIEVNIEFGRLTVCAGPSGSGKSSFAFDTLIKKENCSIENYPQKVLAISQKISSSSKKLEEIEKIKNEVDSLIVIDEPLAGVTHEEAIIYSKIIKDLSFRNAVVVVEHRKKFLTMPMMYCYLDRDRGQTEECLSLY